MFKYFEQNWDNCNTSVVVRITRIPFLGDRSQNTSVQLRQFWINEFRKLVKKSVSSKLASFKYSLVRPVMSTALILFSCFRAAQTSNSVMGKMAEFSSLWGTKLPQLPPCQTGCFDSVVYPAGPWPSPELFHDYLWLEHRDTVESCLF